MTNFLFADPSFMGGAASVLDIGGTLVEFNDSTYPGLADWRALASDWAAVGELLQNAISACEEVSEQAK